MILLRGFSGTASAWEPVGWRYTCLVFFVALVAGPICRIVAYFLPSLTPPARLVRMLVWGFCASYGVYLLSVFLPSVIQLSAGATLMTLFASGVVAVMAVTAAPIKWLSDKPILPEKIRRVLLATAVMYFWLCYSVMALARISGPHRPDAFYDVSLCLMVLGLLTRYADRWISFRKRRIPHNLRRTDKFLSKLRHASVPK